MEFRYAKSTAKTLALKPVLAWDPDYTRATLAEAAAMKRSVRELEAGDYVTDSGINWN